MIAHGAPAGTSTMTSRLLLRLAEQRGGADVVARALERAGFTGREVQVRSLRGRISYPEKLALFEAVAAELRDPRIGLSLGAAALVDPALAPLRALVRATGSTATVLRGVSRVSTRFDSAAVFECRYAGEERAELVWRVLPPHRPNRVDCDYNVGLLGQAPVLFGLPPAQVEHLTCQVDGAERCEYTVSWQEGSQGAWWRRRPHRRTPSPDSPDALRADSDQRLRHLQEAVGELVSGASLATTLGRVTELADRALHAPGHLLDVQLPGGDRHRRARGLGTAMLEILGEDRLEPGSHDVGGRRVLAVPVATASTTYGVLAVVTWPGQEYFPGDVDLLAAYAQHAAAAIEMSHSLSEARDQEETARLLLGVARSLAGRRSVEQIAQTIADAVPALCGADRSAVALWEPGTGSVWMAGVSGWPAELVDRALTYVTTTEECPELCQMVTGSGPMLINRESSAWSKEHFDEFGLTALGGVPISVDDQLVGIVLAHWADSAPPDAGNELLAERLWGLAGLAGVALDNTRLLEELRHRSCHDTLTGLPNRDLFESRLVTAVEDCTVLGEPVAVLVGNVGRLARVNEALGRGAGDQVLRQVAARLSSVIRGGDTVARFSGDEFAVLLPGTGPVQAQDVISRIYAALEPPVPLGPEHVFVDLSIGSAVGRDLLGGDVSPEEDGRRLIMRATEDLRAVRARNRVSGPSADHSPDRLRLEADLHGAVARGDIRVHFQPQVDVADGRVVAVEALARWHHPELGVIPPDVFVPIAESSGLIKELGAHVLRTACCTVAGWDRDGLHLEVAVNVSAVQLTDPSFTELVHLVLGESGLPARRLTLEVTESQMLSDVAAHHDHLSRLSQAGIGISVDDFGTGYSSLAQLHRLPVTEMKVDRSFTAQLTDDSHAPFVAGIVGLGHGLGLRIVAEGVETPQQLAALRDMGCHRAQGYLISRPVAADDLRDLLLAGGPAPAGLVGTGDHLSAAAPTGPQCRRP